jgi:3-dehydroquinate synthase
VPSARVDLAGRSYPVIVERGALDRLGSVAAGFRPEGSAALITDANVDSILGDRCERRLGEVGLSAVRVVVEAGETSKSLSRLETLCRELARAGLDRSALLVAVGGGVLTDLAGFAAAVFLRGIDWIAVPTTLQGQLDAAIGGKTGVNLPEGKNLVGAFHQPLAVLADPLALATLPADELRSGLAEAVKCGVIGDPDLFALLERTAGGIIAEPRDALPGALEEIVFRSARLKAEVVSSDERETGRRAILNFGHTVGHAVEAAAGYGTYRHGEAVSLGMIAAGRLGVARTGFAPSDAARVERLLLALGLAARLKAPLDRAALRQAMARDKKHVGGELRFVLPEAIGRVRAGVAVTDAELDAALSSIGV